MPLAINTTSKFLSFRAFYGEAASLLKGPPPASDKGYYFRINSVVDLRLVRFTLEDNGLVNDRGSGQWSLFWTCSQLKPSFFAALRKH